MNKVKCVINCPCHKRQPKGYHIAACGCGALGKPHYKSTEK